MRKFLFSFLKNNGKKSKYYLLIILKSLVIMTACNNSNDDDPTPNSQNGNEAGCKLQLIKTSNQLDSIVYNDDGQLTDIYDFDDTERLEKNWVNRFRYEYFGDIVNIYRSESHNGISGLGGEEMLLYKIKIDDGKISQIGGDNGKIYMQFGYNENQLSYALDFNNDNGITRITDSTSVRYNSDKTNITAFIFFEKDDVSGDYVADGQMIFKHDEMNNPFKNLLYPVDWDDKIWYEFFNKNNVTSYTLTGYSPTNYSYSYNEKGYPTMVFTSDYIFDYEYQCE